MRTWMMLLLAAVVLAGCVQQECTVRADCMHKPHAECVGGWECIDSSCVYVCEKNETPKAAQNDTTTQKEKPLEIAIVKFSSDKPEYGSSENVSFSITVNCSRGTNATIIVKGINPASYYFIDKSEELKLEQGLNELSITALTPHCTSGCGGVHPGNYTMTAEIDVNETAMDKKNMTIALHS